MKLRGKQKSFLRSEAHHLNPVVQIGKSGLSETLLDQIDECLERRELIKVSLLQNTEETAKDVAEVIEETLHADVVQMIGRVLVVFRPSSKEKYQRVSQQVRVL
ncbi:ribosome assembly RNA-binding protein YhbY [Vagococcus sp.]|uniref:ribosome assembly RNA-binding protein YhbY n=1 Tax=Vagococcus sp. TaxID=1933889 RepID=UPI003F97A59A